MTFQKFSLFFKTTVTVTLLAMCQCSTPGGILADPCTGADPYELGRQHGSQGLPLATANDQNSSTYQCVPSQSGELLQKYMVGYNSGLADYCTRQNGFFIGKSAYQYLEVCPTLSEREFLAGFQAGVEIRETQLENQRIENQISLLQETLKNLGPKSKRSEEVEKTILKLRHRLVRNLKKIHSQNI